MATFNPTSSLRSFLVLLFLLPIACSARELKRVSPKPPSCANTKYYLLMFGSQLDEPEPEYSHSWGTFVKVTWPDPHQPVPRMETITISWLPRSLVIRLWTLHPEPGANFDLHSTLRYVLDNKERVSMWGPYEVDEELFRKAADQLALLNSGQVRYKAVDIGRLSNRVSNCIHALTSAVRGVQPHVFIPAWGETASFVVLQHYRRWIVDHHEHYWISSALGMDAYPIIYREYRNPRTGDIIGVPARLFGWNEERNRPTYGPPVR